LDLNRRQMEISPANAPLFLSTVFNLKSFYTNQLVILSHKRLIQTFTITDTNLI